MRGERRWRVAVYIRLSREDGCDESLSVANQRKIIGEYLEREFPGDWEQVGEYVDDGATGTDWARPGFRRMLADMEAGRVDCVVCKTLSRAFRNYADQGYFLESCFPRMGVRFISLDGPRVDTYLQPEALWGYEVPISGIMNDRYAGRTSQDVRRTLDMKRRRGEFIGAFAPYGYAKDPETRGKLVEDPEAAGVVRDIFAWRLEGLSCPEIARRLDRMGVPTPSVYKRRAGQDYHNPKLAEGGGLWSPRTVSGILENPVYIGDMVQGRQRVVSYKIHQRRAVPREEWFVAEGTHPPLVERAVFQAVQGRRGRTRRVGDEQPLAGLLFCARCGRPMRRKSAKGLSYYACRREAGCPGSSIREDRAERLLLLWVLREEWTGAEPSRQERPADRERARERERARLKQVLAELYLDWKMERLSQEDYQRIRSRGEERLARLEEAREPALHSEWEGGELERLDRDLLGKLVERVVVEGRERVKIFLRFRPSGRQKA